MAILTANHGTIGISHKSSANQPDISRPAGSLFANLFPVYLNATKGIKEVIECMAKIYNDPDADSEERTAALDTLLDVLFPPTDGEAFGIDLAEMADGSVEESKEIAESMSRQNAYFADAVRKHMKRQKVTQSAIAKKIGIRQSAVSMILSRKCRPQRETVKKFAKALGVEPKQFWPF